MSENNNDNDIKKSPLFLKRQNQFKKKKEQESINVDNSNNTLLDSQLNKESNINTEIFDGEISKSRDFISENLDENLEDIDLTLNTEEIYEKINTDNDENNVEEKDITLENILEMESNDIINLDMEENKEENNESLNNNLLKNIEEKDINLDSLPEKEDKNNDDFIDLDDDDDDDDIMKSLLSNADEIIEEQKENLNEENQIDYIEEDITLSTDDNELEEIYEEENNEISENLTEIKEEDYEGYYNENELNEKRKKIGKINKELFIKIGIGIGCIVIILCLALGIRKFLSNKKNPEKIPETVTSTEEIIPTTEEIKQEKNEENNKISAKDDLLDDFNNESETIEETTVSNSENNDVSLFIQNYKGYVVDIKNNQILVADLTYDKYNTLIEDFNKYLGDSNKTVIINNKPEVNEETNNNTENETQTEETESLSNEESEEDLNTETEESTETQENINYNLFHIEGCELIKENKTSMIAEDAVKAEYKPCEICCKDLNVKLDVSLNDYDYSQNASLKNIIFKKFIIDESFIMPDWLTIGSEVNLTFIQDPESLINEIVELTQFEKVESENNQSETNTEETANQTEQVDTISGTNVWGENWAGVVATINDRRDREKASEENKNNDILSLENIPTKESLETVISIGKASIVWFRIGFKGTKEAYFPELNEIAVELQTANGSLINDSNIEKYGKKWIADDGTINFVIKNTIAGDWKVLFTKNIGNYLGNIKIEAVPITGFLQIIDASAVYSDGKLRVIWNAGGVTDDNCKVQIFAKNGNKDILMYSANTIDDGIHTVDMVDIDAKKIAGATYDIYLKITDIDVSPTEPKSITATYITDTKTIENIEIPDFTIKTQE